MLPPIGFAPQNFDHQFDIVHQFLRADSSDFLDLVNQGYLERLDEHQLNQVLRDAENREIIHIQARNKRYQEAIRTLVSKGMNLNALNSVGRSVLPYVEDLAFYRELKQAGARFIDPQQSELNYLRLRLETPGCPDLLNDIPLESYLELSDEERFYTLQRVKKRELKQLVIVIHSVILRMQESSHDNIVRLLTYKDLEYCQRFSAFSRFKTIVNSSLLISRTIEAVMTSPCHLKIMKNYKKKVVEISKHGPFSLQFYALKAIQGPEVAWWCLGLLKSNTLNEAVELLKVAGSVIHSRKCFGKESLRLHCLQHLRKLEHEEREKNETVLSLLEYARIGGDNLKALIDLGIEFKDLLFTFFIYDSGYALKESSSWYDLTQRNANGLNALEYWTCQDFLKKFEEEDRFRIWRNHFDLLVSLGLRITPAHPFYEDCVKYFPNHPYYQALFAHHLQFDVQMDTSYEKSAIEEAVKKMQDPYKKDRFSLFA